VNFTLPGTKLAMKFPGQLAWQDKQGNAGIRFVDAAPRMKRNCNSGWNASTSRARRVSDLGVRPSGVGPKQIQF
jgi:hypothetical protein